MLYCFVPWQDVKIGGSVGVAMMNLNGVLGTPNATSFYFSFVIYASYVRNVCGPTNVLYCRDIDVVFG